MLLINPLLLASLLGPTACPTCDPSTWTPLSSPANLSGAGGAGGAPRYRADIVVSHCRFRIRWLRLFRAELESCGFDVRRVTVYSKCGKADVGAPAGSTVIRLPNVGRCDHSYAHHLAGREEHGADVTLFLKDSILGGSSAEFRALRVGVCSMAHIALTSGFACGRRPIPSALAPGSSIRPVRSDYHDASLLSGFEMPQYVKTHDQKADNPSVAFNASVRPLGAWLRAVDSTLAQSLFRRELVPVCYGGSFAVQGARIRAVPRLTWSRFADELKRGSNIEEGHIMERLWAALLTPPLPAEAADRLRRAAHSIVSARDGAFWLRGSLDGCTCPA